MEGGGRGWSDGSAPGNTQDCWPRQQKQGKRQGAHSPAETSEGTNPPDTLIQDFQLSELRENELLLFYATKLMVISYSSHRRLNRNGTKADRLSMIWVTSDIVHFLVFLLQRMPSFLFCPVLLLNGVFLLCYLQFSTSWFPPALSLCYLIVLACNSFHLQLIESFFSSVMC